MILRVWYRLAWVMLVVSAAAHVSTFLIADPMDAVPHIMLIHVAISPPFVAALVYAIRTQNPNGAGNKSAP